MKHGCWEYTLPHKSEYYDEGIAAIVLELTATDIKKPFKLIDSLVDDSASHYPECYNFEAEVNFLDPLDQQFAAKFIRSEIIEGHR